MAHPVEMEVKLGQGKDGIFKKIEKHFGFNKAKIFWEISQDAKKEVISRMKLHNIDCDFSPGIINATINRKDTNNLFDEVNNLKKKYKYTKIQKLSSSELSTIIDTDLYDGGCLDFGAGHLNPLKFVQGLGTAAKKIMYKFLRNAVLKKLTMVRKILYLSQMVILLLVIIS